MGYRRDAGHIFAGRVGAGVFWEAAAEDRRAARRKVLAHLGAAGGMAEELLAVNEPKLPAGVGTPPGPFPLEDEPHLEVWREYLADARRSGAIAALSGRLVQLSFPVLEGMSRSEAYLAATRRGAPVSPKGGLELEDPEGVELELYPSLGGTIPVLTAARRGDFVTLVRALTVRNEPVPVPDSMGACIVSGLVNWDRVRRHRRAWEARNPDAGEKAWRHEFAALASRKELYQDRLILLSRGPYSGLEAAQVGVPAAAWERLSVALRRAHEITHYLTLRVFGRLQHNVLEELVADFAALVEVFGEYRGALARAFLGLESLPTVRRGGRLANYRGSPPISDDAFTVQAHLASAAIDSLGCIASAAGGQLSQPHRLANLVCALVPLSLEELVGLDHSDRWTGPTGAWLAP